MRAKINSEHYQTETKIKGNNEVSVEINLTLDYKVIQSYKVKDNKAVKVDGERINKNILRFNKDKVLKSWI